MNTTGKILVQAAFGLYPDDKEKLQEYLALRIDQVIDGGYNEAIDSEVEQILKEICNICNARYEIVKSKIRTTEEVEARVIMANILYSKAFYGWTQKRIGHYLGNRDHSTIIHCLENFQTFYETDRSFKRKAELATLIATKIIKNESIQN